MTTLIITVKTPIALKNLIQINSISKVNSKFSKRRICKMIKIRILNYKFKSTFKNFIYLLKIKNPI